MATMLTTVMALLAGAGLLGVGAVATDMGDGSMGWGHGSMMGNHDMDHMEECEGDHGPNHESGDHTDCPYDHPADEGGTSQES